MIGDNSKYEAETILLSYGWHPDKGHWITVAMNIDEMQGHPFQGLKRGLEQGQRFRMTFTPILDNEETPQEPAKKEPRRWQEMPASQQAGVLCNEPAFIDWLASGHPSLWTAVREDTPEGSAVDVAAAIVRHLCGVTSRAKLDEQDGARAKWDALVTRYRQETGREAEPR